MTAPFSLGPIGHIALAVRDPRASADWYIQNLGVAEWFASGSRVAVGNDDVLLVLYRGEPVPATVSHLAFDLPDVATLRVALAHLKANGVAVEDPGDEIGLVAPGSESVGIWFTDPNGYRLELMVAGGAKQL